MAAYCTIKNTFLVIIVIVGLIMVYISHMGHTPYTNIFPRDFSLNMYATETNQVDNLSYAIKCSDRPLRTAVQQHSGFWVFYNFIRAEKEFSCAESITYTTQADYTFLGDVVPLVERWRGPVSIAIYAPGEDFYTSLRTIAYLRNCETNLVKKYVTFHIFFNLGHVPNQSTVPLTAAYEDKYDCTTPAPYKNADYRTLFKTKANLTYPINIARNIARQAAQTHFVLVSDIELYPTRNLIPKFFKMINENPELVENNLNIFPLPVFEIQKKAIIPENKTALQEMIKVNQAIWFHHNICAPCHAVPKAAEWIAAHETSELGIFTSEKRTHNASIWEAFYIGTRNDPLFDERLTWEGQSNKMVQAFTMCLLDYNYMILDNAFLTHKPGIKGFKVQKQKYRRYILMTKASINSVFRPDYFFLFGKNSECVLK